MIVADRIVQKLIEAGVSHVFGVGGANIEDMFAAVQRRRPEIRAVLMKHEHGAGCAAIAYARVQGGLGVVLATSGGGAMNLVHSVAEAQTSRVPVLAIVGEPPTDQQGEGAFQDTSGRRGALDAAAVFGAAATYCGRAENAAQVPQLIDRALACLAVGGGCAVVLIAKDRQRAEIEPIEPLVLPAPSLAGVDSEQLRAIAQGLAGRRCVILAGDEIVRARARPELAQLAGALHAKVAVAPDARDAFDNYAPAFLGVAGAMGHAAVNDALSRAEVCLLAGTRLPVLTRMGLEASLEKLELISLGAEPPFGCGRSVRHVPGELRGSLRELAVHTGPCAAPPQPVESRDTLQHELPAADALLDSASVFAALERRIDVGSVVLVDAGNTGASAAHHLRLPQRATWLMAMGMAGMGFTFGAAVGAAVASRARCWVVAGDGAFFMHGLEIHTAIEHALPITYVIFNNRAHGMCLVRERLLLHDSAGYNVFGPSRIASGLAAMFPGLVACDCRSRGEVDQALAMASRTAGPCVIGVELGTVEVPPFVAFQRVDPHRTTVSRGGSDECR